MLNAIRLAHADHVANVLEDISEGDKICFSGEQPPVIATGCVPKHHKIALADISGGDVVIRGGMAIGEATVAIRKGTHVHVHNLKSRRAACAQGEKA